MDGLKHSEQDGIVNVLDVADCPPFAMTFCWDVAVHLMNAR